MSRYLVTGATGRLGGRVVECLLRGVSPASDDAIFIPWAELFAEGAAAQA